MYRCQKSGNHCFMHAPNVVLHYVVCKHRVLAGDDSEGHLKEMVDLTAYLLKRFDGSRLWKYLYADSGGHSTKFLQELGGLRRREVLVRQADFFEEDAVGAAAVVHNLVTFGPALIAQFSTFAAFKKGGDSFIGSNDAESTGSHAMAMVGYRRVGAEVRFLVQNWWRTKQFFECDLAFLVSRDATLVWVTASLRTLPNSPPTLDCVNGEGDAGGEDMCEEER